MKLVILIIITTGLFIQSCSSQKATDSQESLNNNNNNNNTTEMPQTVKEQTILLDKDKIYELAFAEIIPEKAAQLNNEYFPKAMPIFSKYGGKMLGGFQVVKNENKLLPSNMVVIFEWTNAEARLSYLADKESKKIAHLRDEAIKNINLGFFKVEENKEITFKSNKVYEFVSANLYPTDEAGAELQKYFEASEPIKRNYGGSYPKFLTKLTTIESKGQATFEPQIQLIVEWDSVEDNEKLFANDAFKTKALPHFNKALESKGFVFTKFVFN